MPSSSAGDDRSREEPGIPELNLLRELERRFRALTELLYDTSVSAERLDTEVLPYIAQDVTFKDPWQSAGGREAYRLGMKGFHAMFRFRFEFRQVNVQLNARGDGGRAIVDGVMQLEQLRWLYVFPLRTLLVYDFVLPKGLQPPARPLITTHEEMWSFGDMIEAVPLVSRFYDVFRPAFSRGFLAASRLACRWQKRKSSRG